MAARYSDTEPLLESIETLQIENDKLRLYSEIAELPRQVRHVPMEELVDTLAKKSKEYLEIMMNLKSEQRFDRGTRAYLHDVMMDTERELHELNANYMYHYYQQQGRPQTAPLARQHDYERQRDMTGNADDRSHMEKVKPQLEDRQREVDTLKRVQEEERQHSNHVTRLLKETRAKLEQSEKEKCEYITRLSKLASDKLTQGNPDVTDLSDPNRPIKLSEIYREIYDNEWTDAYEVLRRDGRTELEAIYILRKTLLDTVDFCREKASKLLKITEETVNSLFEDYDQTLQLRATVSNFGTGSKTYIVGAKKSTEGLFRDDTAVDECVIFEKWEARYEEQPSSTLDSPQSGTMINKPNILQHVKTLRKEIARSMVPTVQKAYLKPRWTKQCYPLLKPYIRKCLHVGWMMCVQDPPMVLTETMANPGYFDKSCFTYFSRVGARLDYIVWPAMLIQERGALLSKGVAQGVD